jgi:hypothetical protein
VQSLVLHARSCLPLRKALAAMVFNKLSPHVVMRDIFPASASIHWTRPAKPSLLLPMAVWAYGHHSQLLIHQSTRVGVSLQNRVRQGDSIGSLLCSPHPARATRGGCSNGPGRAASANNTSFKMPQHPQYHSLPLWPPLPFPFEAPSPSPGANFIRTSFDAGDVHQLREGLLW